MLAETQHPTRPFKLWSQFQTHWELIFALLAGLFILSGWLLSQYGYSGLSVLAYVLAFGIGGFAKAKEGIIDTLEHRKLNVEMLMVMAAVGSALIGYWVEGAILILIFSLSGNIRNVHDEQKQERNIGFNELAAGESGPLRGRGGNEHSHRLTAGQ